MHSPESRRHIRVENTQLQKQKGEKRKKEGENTISLVTLPEEILSAILEHVGYEDELGFIKSQHTCRRLRSTIRQLMTTRPQTLFPSLQQFPDPFIIQFRDNRGRISEAVAPRRYYNDKNDGRNYTVGDHRFREKFYQVNWLLDRFGFLLNSDYPFDFPEFILSPLPFNRLYMTEDIFRCVPWAAAGRKQREPYLRAEASWRSIPIYSPPSSTPGKTIKRIQVLNISGCDHIGIGWTDPLRLWANVSTTTTTTTTTTTDTDIGGNDDDNPNEKMVTLGFLWDLILSSRFRSFDRWELFPGYVVDTNKLRPADPNDDHDYDDYNYNNPNYREDSLWKQLSQTMVRDDEAATLVLDEAQYFGASDEMFSVRFAFENLASLESMRKMEEEELDDLWDPEPIGRETIRVGQCQTWEF